MKTKEIHFLRFKVIFQMRFLPKGAANKSAKIMQIDFQPQKEMPLKILEDVKRHLAFYKMNLAQLSRQKYKLLKFLNIIKQKEYCFERFFLQYNFIFQDFSQKERLNHMMRNCLLFLEEMGNFYCTEASRLKFLRKGVLYVLSQCLLSTHRKVLALISKPDQFPNTSRISTGAIPFYKTWETLPYKSSNLRVNWCSVLF